MGYSPQPGAQGRRIANVNARHATTGSSPVIFSFGVGYDATYDPSFDAEAASRLPSCKVISLDPTLAARSVPFATCVCVCRH